MKENFPNLVKEIDMKSRKHRVPSKMDAKRPTPTYIAIKISKVKDRILNAAKEISSFRKEIRKRSSHKTANFLYFNIF